MGQVVRSSSEPDQTGPRTGSNRTVTSGVAYFAGMLLDKRAPRGIGLAKPLDSRAKGYAVLHLLAQATSDALGEQIGTWGISAVIGFVLLSGSGLLVYLIKQLLGLSVKTTEVVENNTHAVRSLEKQGTEQMHEFRRLNDDLRSRPCQIPQPRVAPAYTPTDGAD